MIVHLKIRLINQFCNSVLISHFFLEPVTPVLKYRCNTAFLIPEGEFIVTFLPPLIFCVLKNFLFSGYVFINWSYPVLIFPIMFGEDQGPNLTGNHFVHRIRRKSG